MTEVRAAIGAVGFGAGGADFVIGGSADGVFVYGLIKAGPAGAGVEFACGAEEVVAAAFAVKVALPFYAVKWGGAGFFCAFGAEDVVFLLAQAGAPFFVGELEWEGVRVGFCAFACEHV